MSISVSVIYSNHLIELCHGHQLIKNEDYHAREGDRCYGCGLLLSKSSIVYHCTYIGTSAEENCAHFFLHKTCAHLPIKLKHSSHQEHVLNFSPRPPSFRNCDVCGIKWKRFTYGCYDCNFQICLPCVIPLNNFNIYPPYHGHKLTLLATLASFRCDVCHKVDTDFSYICYTCPFWIHLRCCNLPTLLECKVHHKHPLRLAYSLPENYRKFLQSCRICKAKLDPRDWLYYCPNCRFFAHIICATTTPNLRKNEADFDESKFVHLPPPDHESLLQQCTTKEIISWSEDAAVTPPDHIKHWSHEHQLVLKNNSVLSTTDEEGILPICNGCNESTSTSINDVYYECRECDFILHRYCARFPKEMQHLRGKLVGIQPSVHDIWSCTGCEGFRNGTQMRSTDVVETTHMKSIINVKLDIGCAVLPKLNKHEAHPHLLTQYVYNFPTHCDACNKTISEDDTFFKCNELIICSFYIHIKCALKPRRVTHRWDRHPLHLIFSPEEVIDHPHEFHCEFCSEEIDTNYWFYHCSVCDLSFHFGECIDVFFPYSKIKFGATNIKIDAHQHGLTFVLNKKNRQQCQRCHKDTYGKPVLECTSCKFIQHAQPDLCS